MKMRNLIKEKLNDKGYILGAFIASGSTTNIEILGLNGLDFALIDMEHAQTNMETLVEMIRASELYGMVPLARVYDPKDGPMMSRMLDVGIHGIMVPLVNNRKHADLIIKNTKLAPLGNRGIGVGRATLWGEYENYNKGEANDNTFIIMQCETKESVENIEEICQTPGLDSIFIGMADLTQDYGCYGNGENPEIKEAVKKVLNACEKYNIIPGIVTGTKEAAINRIKQGFKLVTVMNDLGFFKTQSKVLINSINQELSK